MKDHVVNYGHVGFKYYGNDDRLQEIVEQSRGMLESHEQTETFPSYHRTGQYYIHQWVIVKYGVQITSTANYFLLNPFDRRPDDVLYLWNGAGGLQLTSTIPETAAASRPEVTHSFRLHLPPRYTQP